MAKSGALEATQVPDEAEQNTSCPRVPKRLRIGTAIDIRRERAAVYKDMRYRRIHHKEGTGLSSVLNDLLHDIEMVELVARIAAVERKLDK